MRYKLSELAEYVSEKVNTDEIALADYVSTENLLPDKQGLSLIGKLPNTKRVNKFKKGDILISNIRPYFKKIWFANRDGGCSADVLTIRSKGIVSSEFLFTLLFQDSFFDYMMLTSKGTKMPRGDKKSIMEVEFDIPPEKVQRKTENFFFDINSKVELNKRIISTLEETAGTLFQHWFVDFEFPDENGNPYKSSGGKMVESELGEIPEGWGVTTLEKYLEVKYGKDHKKLADGKYPVYGSGGVMRYVDDYLYDNESVLVPRKGTLNNVMYVHGPFWSVDTMFYTIMKKKNTAKFIYLFLDRVDLKSMNVGSAVPSMTTKILNNMKIIQPSENMLTNFEVTVGPMFEKIKQLHTENDRLSELRDTLLPKLLSGEIELPAEEEVRV